MNESSIITLSGDTVQQEHICCAMSDKKCENGVKLKKQWLTERFEEGLRFKKLNVKHKVFIEYLPAEYAWCPIEAPDYLFINCFWVAGSYKGKGHGSRLLQECIEEAKGKNGLVAVTSKTKRPYLSDKSFFVHNGFEVCDTAPPYFELMVLRIKDADNPRFKESARLQNIDPGKGIQLFYTVQCPYTDHYVGELQLAAAERGIPIEVKRIESGEEAQRAPSAYTTYSLFYKGHFITHEIMTRNKFEKTIDKWIENYGQPG